MPSNIHLKLDGVKGESTDENYKEAMDLLHWEWNVVQEGATGAQAGKAKVHNLKVYKVLDAASATLMLRCLDGNKINKGTLTQSRQAGGKETVFVKIELENIRVADATMSALPMKNAPVDVGPDMAQVPVEEISLAFGIVKVEYTPVNPRTQEAGTPVPIAWDVQANKPP